jgi:hypothetical protein
MHDNYGKKTTHSEYLIIIASSRKRWLRERVSILHQTHIVCFVDLLISFTVASPEPISGLKRSSRKVV